MASETFEIGCVTGMVDWQIRRALQNPHMIHFVNVSLAVGDLLKLMNQILYNIRISKALEMASEFELGNQVVSDRIGIKNLITRKIHKELSQ